MFWYPSWILITAIWVDTWPDWTNPNCQYFIIQQLSKLLPWLPSSFCKTNCWVSEMRQMSAPISVQGSFDRKYVEKHRLRHGLCSHCVPQGGDRSSAQHWFKIKYLWLSTLLFYWHISKGRQRFGKFLFLNGKNGLSIKYQVSIK